jgi:hypothetical protein
VSSLNSESISRQGCVPTPQWIPVPPHPAHVGQDAEWPQAAPRAGLDAHRLRRSLTMAKPQPSEAAGRGDTTRLVRRRPARPLPSGAIS